MERDFRASQRFRIRNTRVVARIPEILRLCESKKVLHIGCADIPFTLQRGDNLLHKRLLKITAHHLLWGLEKDAEGVKLLRNMGFDHIIQGDAENVAPELVAEDFDIILAGEIIEHTSNPGQFLDTVATLMTTKTQLILTTVNASSIRQLFHSLLREEKVHEDHNYYFSYRTLMQLLAKHDLKCQEIYYYQELAGRGIAAALDRILKMMTLISPLLADGVIVIATR